MHLRHKEGGHSTCELARSLSANTSGLLWPTTGVPEQDWLHSRVKLFQKMVSHAGCLSAVTPETSWGRFFPRFLGLFISGRSH